MVTKHIHVVRKPPIFHNTWRNAPTVETAATPQHNINLEPSQHDPSDTENDN